MRVLVTGAAGVLGQAVTQRLERSGDYRLRLTDMAPVGDARHEFIQADLSDAGSVRGLCRDVDQVLHIAAIHPWKPYTPDQYYDCNIKGTHNVLEEAARAGVQRVILTSSIAAMGYGLGPGDRLPFDESKTLDATENVYGITKQVSEQLCRMFHRSNGLAYVALRPGTFIPREDDDPQLGRGLLTQWLHGSDVADAHVLALESQARHEAFVITAKIPFTCEDADALANDARPVILRYFPRAKGLEDLGVALPQTITRWYSIAKAERELHYQPKLNFGEWVERMLEPE